MRLQHPLPSRVTRTDSVCPGFTLVELLVSMAVLTLLILLITQLLNNATSVTTTGNKHIDADSQSRAIFDRMQIDFGQMVKRGDLDYFAKNTASPNSAGGAMTGNDQIAFFSEVPGYSATTTGLSPASLIVYRLNTDVSSPANAKMQRMGKGLLWNGATASDPPIVYLPLTLTATWPNATTMAADPDYEVIGPQVFRFEYFYVLKNGTLSDTPWDVGAGHTSIEGWRDVAAVSASIAVLDANSRVLVTDAQLNNLAAAMDDFDKAKQPGAMELQWQAAIDASPLLRTAASACRIYHRYFYLVPKAL